LDAAGLAARLGALAAALPTPAPLPLVRAHADTSSPISAPGLSQLTEDGATTAIVAGTDQAAPIGTKAGPGEVFDAEPYPNGHGTTVLAGLRRAPKPKKAEKLKKPRRTWGWRRIAWIAAAVLLAVLLAAGLTVAFATDAFTPTHPTPSLSGLTLGKARTEVSRVHMTLRVKPAVKSITAAAGTVVSQSPAAHSSQKEGTVVTVVPSSGPPVVGVPNLTGMTCATGAATLQQAHFQSVCAPATYNNDGVPEGVLVLWSIGNVPNPTQAPYGSTITMVPSQGHAPATVPDIPSSYTFAQAQAAIQAVGLTASQNTEASTSVPAGQVITPTEPPSGASASFGSNVQVNVSTGPPTTTVPNVANQPVPQATATLQAAGLSASGVTGNPGKPVTNTSPPIGSNVPTGSSVQLVTS
jgi:serine/threonine-protein kinase